MRAHSGKCLRPMMTNPCSQLASPNTSAPLKVQQSVSTGFCAERKTPQEYQISKNKIEMFFADVPYQGHYSTNANHFCNARLLSCQGLAQIFTWKNGNENIPPVPLQALLTWNPARRSYTLHTCWPQVRKGNPFPIGEVLFVGVSPSVTTRPWWRNVWRNCWRNR